MAITFSPFACRRSETRLINMKPPIQILAPSLSAEARETFEVDVGLVAAVYDGLREDLGLPDASVRLILAADFVGEVERNLRDPFRSEEGGSFSVVRAGGEVAAKGLDQVGDGSDIVIVFNAALWTHAQQPEVRAMVAHLVAHELAHPIIDRARHVSGVMDGVIIPSVTGQEVAASMARIMVGEYRADRIADGVVSWYMTATVDGEVVPAFNWMTSADSWASAVEAVAAAAHPRWPDVVQEYREWRMDLTAMFGTIVSSIDETITTIVHAQASADSAGSGRDLMAEEPIASLPAARLYLGDTWAPFLAALRAGPQICPLAEFRACDEAVTEVGRDAIFEIWSRLGLRPIDRGNREWGLMVDEPLR